MSRGCLFTAPQDNQEEPKQDFFPGVRGEEGERSRRAEGQEVPAPAKSVYL